MSIRDAFSGGIHSFANWLAPVPPKEEPKVEPQVINEEPKVEQQIIAPKELSFMEKAEIVAGEAKKIAKIVGSGLIAFAALYGALDKGMKNKAGKTGSLLEAGGNIFKFVLEDDKDAGKKGLTSIISLTNKPQPTFSGKIIHV